MHSVGALSISASVDGRTLGVRHLYEQGKLNLDEAFVDATFASAKKRGFAVDPTRRGKGTKIIAIAAGNSLPLAVSVQSASPADCRLVEEVLAGSLLDELPARLIGDKAYDSDPLDQTLLSQYGIELIAPTGAGEREIPRTHASYAAIEDDGKWSGSLRGCTTSEGPSLDGNIHRKLPRLRTPRLPPYATQTFMRPLLGSAGRLRPSLLLLKRGL